MLPRFDDTATKLKDCTVFTKLNAANTYHQFSLVHESHLLTMFVQGVQGRKNSAWNNLESNQPKCEQYVKELIFYGHKFSADGIAVDFSKVSAIADMPELTNITELFHSLDTWPVAP